MIDLNREEFEKLPEIARKLHTVLYNEQFNNYHAAMINSAPSVKYVQGAWYAFQEQQKKLNCCREENKAHLEKIDELQARVNYLSKKFNDLARLVLDECEYILKGNKDD